MDGQRFLDLTEDELDDGTLVMGLVGELDVAAAQPVKAALRAAEERRYRRIVVDLSEISLIDSTGLSVLVGAPRRGRRGGTGRARAAPPTSCWSSSPTAT